MNLRQANLEQARSLSVDSSLITVAKFLRDNKLRHVYLIDEKEFPVGIVSITDINNKVVAEGKDPKMLKAEAVMTTPVHMMDIDHEPSKAYAEMLAHDTYTLPITDNGLLVGVLSMKEILNILVAQKRQK
jgi:signal-transduction protein with cAMP-binding, CBS, and nucleotidyltransferase domain